MAKKLSDWNLFVKKIYAEGKSKNANYKFEQALKDASKRKSEMKKHSHHGNNTYHKKSRAVKSGGTRRRRKH